MDKLTALAQKVGATQPRNRFTQNRGPNAQNQRGGYQNRRPNRNQNPKNNNNSSTGKKNSPRTQASKEYEEMEKFLQRRMYKALGKNRRDRRIEREKASTMGQRIKLKSKDARLKRKGLITNKFEDEDSSTDYFSSEEEEVIIDKYMKVPIEKKEEDFSQLQTHEYGEKDRLEQRSDFFLTKKKRYNYTYCSFLTSKMKPDIMTCNGWIEGKDYTYDFLKSGVKATSVLEVRAFYDSDENTYYEHINDYVHDQLVKNVPGRSFRYFNDDIFVNTLVCDLCHKLGHTVNMCKLKLDTCILCGSSRHVSQQCYLKSCFFCKESNHAYSRCPDIQSRRFNVTAMERCNKCLLFGHSTHKCFIRVLREKHRKEQADLTYCIYCLKPCTGQCKNEDNHKFIEYDDEFYHPRLFNGFEYQWITDFTDKNSTRLKQEFEESIQGLETACEMKKHWMEDEDVKEREKEDQKWHDHIMKDIKKNDIDYQRAIAKDRTEGKEEFVFSDGKLVSVKRYTEQNKTREEQLENEIRIEQSFDHIHGGPTVDKNKENEEKNKKAKEDKEKDLFDDDQEMGDDSEGNKEDKKKEAEKPAESAFDKEMCLIQRRVNTQRQLDLQTMLKQCKTSDSKKYTGIFPIMKNIPVEDHQEVMSDRSDDDMGCVGFQDKSYEIKIKTDFMRKLSCELNQLIKEEVNKDIGDLPQTVKNDVEVNPFETFFGKHERPGLFYSQVTKVEDTSSQDGSVWTNEHKKSAYSFYSRHASTINKQKTTPPSSDVLLMRSDHSKASERKSKASGFDFFMEVKSDGSDTNVQ